MNKLSSIQAINDFFWNEEIWLPTNMTWAELSPPSTDKVTYTNCRDLLVPLKLAFVFLLVRFLLETYCFRPFGLLIGISNKTPKRVRPNILLEKAYNSQPRKIPHGQILVLTKQLDWTERQVERWLRVRRAQDKPSTLVKFSESCWRLVYYTSIFCFGVVCQWNQPWLRDPIHLIVGIPHPISIGCWWYCMLTCGFYWSLMLSHFFDVRRKDFYEMVIHHVVLISLVSLTWITNGHRYLCLGLLMHDCSDILLESAKLSKYARLQKTSICLFSIMSIVWVGTRCVWFPCWILRTTLFVFLEIYPLCLIYFVLNFLLLSVFALNILWTKIILRILISSIVNGPDSARDCRSSTEQESDAKST